MRRFAILFLALVAVTQTGCCGRWRAFFYRVFHCDCCNGPYYGYGGCGVGCGGPAVYAAPAYSSPACATCATPGYVAPTVPVAYAAPAAPQVFGPSTPLPPPTVQPGVPTPMGEKK